MSKTKKQQREEEKDVFWWIYNQEEVPVAMSYAKTAGGALAKFEASTGISRASYRAEKTSFRNGCSVTSMVP